MEAKKDREPEVKLALPKGRMQEGVTGLLADAGIRVRAPGRGYRPSMSLDGFEAKILKPQNIIEMLAHGSRDVGFAGADWVAELELSLTELLDTGLDPVRIVAACDSPMGTMEVVVSTCSTVPGAADGTGPRRHARIA